MTLPELLAAYPAAGTFYTAFVRFLFPILAGAILYRAVRSLLRLPHTPETWGQLSLPGGGSVPLTHWENILGRGKSADVRLNYPSVSRQHAALCRNEEGEWTLYDLDSKGGVLLNGEKVEGSAPVKMGDSIGLGGVPLLFLPQTVDEREELAKKRRAERPAAMWPSFLWLNAAVLRLSRCVGFEMETIAFFLSTLSLAVTASSAPGSLFKQLLAVILGLGLFLTLGLFLRDLGRVQRNRWLLAAASIGLLAVTLVLGSRKYGAVNWISLGPLSFQPSEIAKICYIFAGSATLERLFRKRNLTLFIVLTGVCVGLLGLMSDFGTAAIFFVTFLVLAYLRSGDFATLSLICGGAVFGAGLIVKFKPYILDRFAAWGHAWADASGRERLAPPGSGGGHGFGFWHALRGVGAGDCLFRRGGHRGPGVLHGPGLPGGAEQLLLPGRLRRRVTAGVPDLFECVWVGGPSAPDGGDLSLCLQRRVRHDVCLGAAGLLEGHGHPGACQLRDPASKTALHSARLKAGHPFRSVSSASFKGERAPP